MVKRKCPPLLPPYIDELIFKAMKQLLLACLLIGGKTYSQSTYTIKQIDSIVTTINNMPLAQRGAMVEIGLIKNGTFYYYDSTQNTLRKVVQSFGSEEGSMELSFYYAGNAVQKFMFTSKDGKKKPQSGYIYYAGEKVLATNAKDIDPKTNHWRGQSFVEEFQKQ
jgi:hypothetical protein